MANSIDLTIYRCVQEGLTNVVRHAGATSVAIELGEVEERSAVESDGDAHLRLVIRDDGRGIAAVAPMGRGLTGMQERVQALAGTFTIERIAAGGTHLHIAIPLPARAGEAGDDGAAQG